MSPDEIYLTREGYEKLSEELEYLKNTRRREISQAIKRARSYGDISENAEYDAAKEAQALNEKHIAELEDQLSRVRIVEEENIAADEVRHPNRGLYPVRAIMDRTGKERAFEFYEVEVVDTPSEKGA